MDAQEKITEGVRSLLGDPKKAILKLSIPMMIGMLVQALYNLVDAIWVAGLGADALAAVGLFFPFFMIMLALASGLGIGGSSAISRRIGERNKEAADNTAVHMLLLGIIAGLTITLISLPFVENVFLLFGAKGKVVEMSADYARVLFGGAVILIFSNISNAILRGEGDTKRAMYAMLLGSGLNMVLDPIFIYVLDMGVVGAAWATLTSIIVSSMLFFYWLFVKRDTYVEITLEDFHPNRTIIKEIFRVGIPASLMHVSMSVSMFFFNFIVIKVGGTDGIAVLTGGWRIITFGVIPLLGMATGVTAVTGAAYGARDPEKLATAYLYAIKICVLIELGVACVVALFAPQIAFAFTYSEGAAHISNDLITFLRWMALYYPIVPLGMLSSAMFQGIGKGEIALAVTLIRTIILAVPMVYLFGIVLGFGLVGVWWGMIVGNAMAVSIAFTIGKLTIAKFKKSLNPYA
ncbi:MAG: MATE family efflux transporter [Candidatus Methanofastidiosia archaeon]